MYPKIVIDLKKYDENLSFLIEKLKPMHMGLMVVTKVFKADQNIIDIINQYPVDYISDSRINNLKKMKTHHKKALLRLPQACEISDVITYTDLSFNSQLETISKLNDEAKKQNKKHEIILMFDIGDLREGIYYQDYKDHIIESIFNFDHIIFKGIGTNVTCYGGVIPYANTMQKLVEIKNKIESKFKIKLDIISGGNSSIYPMLISNDYPKAINHIRVGELLILGKETSFGTHVEGMHDDIITLHAQIIEIGKKPSKPEGVLGMNAFGETVSFQDRGMIERAIVAIGKQDIHPDHLICPKGIQILGASSDHLIIELPKNHTYKLYDIVTFKLTYGGILSVFQSTDVGKNYV